MLQLMRPAGTARRLLRDGRTAGMDEGGRRIFRLAAGVTHAPQHGADINEYGPIANVLSLSWGAVLAARVCPNIHAVGTA